MDVFKAIRKPGIELKILEQSMSSFCCECESTVTRYAVEEFRGGQLHATNRFDHIKEALDYATENAGWLSVTCIPYFTTYAGKELRLFSLDLQDNGDWWISGNWHAKLT